MASSHQICHKYWTVYLLTSETESQSRWRPQIGGRNINNWCQSCFNCIL